MMMKKIKTANMSREDWLNLRRHSIGGSDAAAIVGLNEYASPFSVWADKRGLTEDKPDNEAMRQGRDLEDYVAQRFCAETGKRVKRCNYTLYNPLYPFAHANIDRSIVGENAGLECGAEKTIYMSIKQIEAHEQKFRKGQNMGKGWREDFDAMARKTVYRKLIGKWGVMSIDYRTVGEGQQIADALAADAEQEKALDNAIDITPPESIDAETGEIKE